MLFTGVIVIQARFSDTQGQHVETKLLMHSHYSPNNKHIKVFTSTNNPRVC